MTGPKISVVTPSFNQARFVRETICSVLGQTYQNIEYIILDAGSTDGSVDIIREYEKRLTYWHSKPDGGQAQAINAGFKMATGDILCWLNSDDMHLPGTLEYVASKLSAGKPGILLGNCLHIKEGLPELYGSDIVNEAATRNLKLIDYVIQPSSFWTRAAWEQVGELDESLFYTLDWDWYIRAMNANVPMITTEKYLSVYRIHEAHKTGTGDSRRVDEIQSIIARYCGQKYADAFHAFRAKVPATIRLRKNLCRVRLMRFEQQVWRIWLRSIAGEIPWEEFKQMSAMAYPPPSVTAAV